MSETYDVEAGLAKLMAWAREDIPDYLHGASGAELDDLAGSGAELDDLAGSGLADAAGDVAEAMETFRDAPFSVTDVAAVLPETDDAPAPAVVITAVSETGAEVQVTVRLTGYQVAPRAAPPHPGLGPSSGHQANGPASCPRCQLLRDNPWIKGA